MSRCVNGLVGVFLGAALVASACSAPGADTSSLAPEAAASASPPGGRLFDGREKSFVVVGYSTSYRWPDILELMMNRHLEDQVLYHVMNAVAGGAPVSTWINAPDTQDWQRSYGRMLRDYFLPLDSRPEMEGRRRYSYLPRPTIALVQQSLQRTSPVIQVPEDAANISAGADALQELVESLHADGVEIVMITTHIYKVTHEPQIEHEKYALAELLSRGLPYVWPGPDLWTPTRERWPEAFAEDEVHPNRLGDGLAARLWYEHLLRFDRGELEQTLDSAWGPGWEVSRYLTERAGQQQR